MSRESRSYPPEIRRLTGGREGGFKAAPEPRLCIDMVTPIILLHPSKHDK